MDKRISTTADAMDRALPLLKAKGQTALERFADWAKPASLPKTGERGGGLADSTPEDRVSERRDDRAASRLLDEYRTLLARMEADAIRLYELLKVGNPAQQTVLGNKHLLSAQIAAEGWCVSCWRDDHHCSPIALRPTGEPYYKDRCRPCGEWKATHGQDPPLPILQKRHQGQRITQRDVDAALGKAG